MKIEIQGRDLEQVVQELRSQLEAEGISSDYEIIEREQQRDFGLMELAAIISIISGTVATGDIVAKAIESRNPKIERVIFRSNDSRRCVTFENISKQDISSISQIANEILEEESLER